ncbi:hypothetical protein KCU91_g15785, partial [Aureobasidium melanogenum]
MRCDCDLEYITTGRTSRDTIQGSIICEKRDKAILKATTRHDKICGCGAFEFIHQKKGNSKLSETPTSSKTPKSSRAHGSSRTSTPSKPPRSSQAHASPKTPTSSRTTKSSKAPASSKTSTPSKTPIYNALASVDCQKDPDNDESDFDENIFKGIPRKF